MVNLSEERTEKYRGGHVLRTELRRLRSFGLIKKTGKAHIGELRSDMTFDLSDYIELTDLGQRWAHQIARLEEKGDSGDNQDQGADDSMEPNAGL